MTEPKTTIVPAGARALALPTPLVVEDGLELVDAFDDDSLEMNEAGDKFRVRRYHFARRILAVSEPTIDVATFTVITACQVPIPERGANAFYAFRGQIIYESSDVSEGMAARVSFDGTLFGGHRYRLSIGDTASDVVKTRFYIFGDSPTPESGGPGAALGYMDFAGGFSCAAGSSGNLSFEVRCETGNPQWVKLRVGTFLEVLRCS
jgi:hypothetical protein